MAGIHLYGPTLFVPILNQLLQIVQSRPAEVKNYNVFLILTDGQINDMEETKKLLI